MAAFFLAAGALLDFVTWARNGDGADLWACEYLPHRIGINASTVGANGDIATCSDMRPRNGSIKPSPWDLIRALLADSAAIPTSPQGPN